MEVVATQFERVLYMNNISAIERAIRGFYRFTTEIIRWVY